MVYDDEGYPSFGKPERSGGPAWDLYDFTRSRARINAEIGSFAGENRGHVIVETFDNARYLDGANPSRVMIEAGVASPPVTGTGIQLGGLSLAAVGGAPGEPLRHGLADIPWSIQNFPRSTITLGFSGGGNYVLVYGTIDTLPPHSSPSRSARPVSRIPCTSPSRALFARW